MLISNENKQQIDEEIAIHPKPCVAKRRSIEGGAKYCACRSVHYKV